MRDRLPKSYIATRFVILLAMAFMLHSESAHSEDIAYESAITNDSFADLREFHTDIDECFNKPCYKPVFFEHTLPKPDASSDELLLPISVRHKYGYGFSQEEYSVVAPVGYFRGGFACKYSNGDCIVLLGAGYRINSNFGISIMERFGSGYDIDTRYSLTLKASESINLSLSAKTQVKDIADHIYLTEGRPISSVTNFQEELERLILIYMSTPGGSF